MLDLLEPSSLISRYCNRFILILARIYPRIAVSYSCHPPATRLESAHGFQCWSIFHSNCFRRHVPHPKS